MSTQPRLDCHNQMSHDEKYKCVLKTELWSFYRYYLPLFIFHNCFGGFPIMISEVYTCGHQNQIPVVFNFWNKFWGTNLINVPLDLRNKPSTNSIACWYHRYYKSGIVSIQWLEFKATCCMVSYGISFRGDQEVWFIVRVKGRIY